ncbi:hypothetical protein B0H13DRAFT_1989011 [Mycena leptocephala]|nr:hypothetical protein B0H13DRAFT_1989011 [Mycena leptocephala]
MKFIQLTALLVSFAVAVMAIPATPLDSRGCSLTLVCDGGASQVTHCAAKGYGCPNNATASNAKCAADCGCLISCVVGP